MEDVENINTEDDKLVNEIVKAIDDKIAMIDSNLLNSKSDVLNRIRSGIEKTSLMSKEMKEMESNVFNTKDEDKKSSSYKDNVKNLKSLVNKYIELVNGVENFCNEIKNTGYDQLIKIEDNRVFFSIDDVYDPLSLFTSIESSNSSKKDNKLSWDTIQKKSDFSLSNNNKTISIDYDLCENLHYAIPEFEANTGVKTFTVEIKNNTNNLSYIGFTNDKYSSSCCCLYQEGAYFLEAIGIVSLGTKREVAKNESFIFKNINLNIKITIDTNSKNISFNCKDKTLGPFEISGDKWKLFVGMCNKGSAEYTLVE